MDFVRLSREYSEDRTTLALVPAWDFRIDGYFHAHMAILRGIENGFAIARSARDGLLTAADSRGRVIAETQSTNGFATVIADVGLSTSRTIYSRTGDWFAWLNVLGTVVLIGIAFSSASTSSAKGRAA